MRGRLVCRVQQGGNHRVETGRRAGRARLGLTGEPWGGQSKLHTERRLRCVLASPAWPIGDCWHHDDIFLSRARYYCLYANYCLFPIPHSHHHYFCSSILEPHLWSHSVWLCDELPGLMLTSSPGSTITLDLPAPILFSYVTSLSPLLQKPIFRLAHP